MLQGKVLCKYAKELWNYSWKPKTNFKVNHASHFRKYSRKRRTSFEVFTLGKWSRVTRRLYLCSKEKKKVFLLKLCAIIFES